MKALITIIILAVIGWAVYAMVNKDEVQTPATNNEVVDTASTTLPGTSTSTGTSTISQVKEFIVNGSNFAFSPSTITVNKGDRVRIVFKNQGGMHDWKLDEFGAKTKVINGGESETIEFVADKAGSFEYYCSIGTHRQMGMKGVFIVK